MAQFKFKDGLILDFGVLKFEVHPDNPDFLEQFYNDCNSAIEFSENIKKSGKSDPDTIREACLKISEILDNTLGENATSSIFGDRPIGLFDLMDILEYITDEITNYKDTRKLTNLSTQSIKHNAVKRINKDDSTD